MHAALDEKLGEKRLNAAGAAPELQTTLGADPDSGYADLITGLANSLQMACGLICRHAFVPEGLWSDLRPVTTGRRHFHPEAGERLGTNKHSSWWRAVATEGKNPSENSP